MDVGRPPATRGPHFFAAVDGAHATATVAGEDARHLRTVLRARPGDPVSISDGRGGLWQGNVAGLAGDAVVVALDEGWGIPRPRPALTVVHALPKARKLDDVVQRLTEIGVDRIHPVRSERSLVRVDAGKAERAVARWRAVALAAAKQSRRAWVPVIEPIGDWPGAFAGGPTGVVLWEESTVPLRSVLAALPATGELVCGIGPEGGLTPAEVEATGLPHASLGPTILRTETAALVAVTAVAYALGRLG